MIEQLEKNQKAITSGLEDIAMLTYQPETQPQSPQSKLPIGYKPSMSPDFASYLDAGFDDDEVQKLMQFNLSAPSSVLQSSMKGDIDINDYDANIGKILKKLGTKKGPLSKGQGKIKKIKTKLIELMKISNYCKNTEGTLK